MKRACILLFVLAAAVAVRTEDGYPNNYVAATLVQLNDNGGWSWFMDPRVIVNEGNLIMGSLRAARRNPASLTDPRSVNVDVSGYDSERARPQAGVLRRH